MDDITTFITSISALILALGSFFVAIQKVRQDVKNAVPKKIKDQCDVDTEIIQELENLKEYLVADRVQIYDFHNGSHYANGRSALKTSCTFEVIRVGVKSYQSELQSLPLSCLPKFIKTLLNKERLKINDIEKIKSDMPATYELKKKQEVLSFFDIILTNKNKEPIGFLAIQYGKTNHVDFNQKEMNEILKTKFFIETKLEQMVTK